MTRKTIVIEYDPEANADPEYGPLDLFGDLRDQFDNAGVNSEIREFDAPEQAASYLSDEVAETVARLEALQDAVSAFESELKDKLLNPMLFPEPPEWLRPLTTALHKALVASKVRP